MGRTWRFVELHQLQHGAWKHSGMDGRLPPHQRAHPSGIFELDAECHWNTLLSLRPLDRGEHPRQLEQCGSARLRRFLQTGGRNLRLSAWSDCLDRARSRHPSESHSRRHSRLRIRADLEERGASGAREPHCPSDCHELEQLDSRLQCLGNRATAIRPTPQSALSPVEAHQEIFAVLSMMQGEESLPVRVESRFYSQWLVTLRKIST